MLSGDGNETRAPNDGFLKYIENTVLAIHNVLLAQQRRLLSDWLIPSLISLVNL